MSPVLYLVRHGRSLWNEKQLVQGQIVHPELTDAGRDEARAAARLLADVGALRLLTSDLVRALQTADEIAVSTGLKPFVTPLLREMDLGDWQGLPTAEVGTLWAAYFARENDEPAWDPELRVPGGESLDDVRARVAALLASPLVAETDGGVILVTHGDTIRIALGYLLGDDPVDTPWREILNGSVHVVDRNDDGEVQLSRLGSTALNL